MSMEAQLNIEVRSRILEYSLVIENLINDLLLMNLGIYNEKEKTKLFSNKGKLTFQNKIDLLFDIEVLSKIENSEFELLMNIRNKFLHDIDCSSFQILLQQLDNGIVNRFKKFLEEGQSISDEEACEQACYKLFQKNIKTIKEIIRKNTASRKIKSNLVQVQNNQLLFYIDFIHDLLNKIYISIENAELENPKVLILGMEIQQILEESVQKLNSEAKSNIYEEFLSIAKSLEKHYGDMQDIEFTIENEKLFILQTRNGKRTAKAAVNIAVDMVNEGKITESECVSRIEPKTLEQLLHPTFDENEIKKFDIISKGLPASPGAASGKIYFNAEDVVKAKKNGEKTILVRQETSPEDIEGMVSAEGILTARGGMTSHAAVVARGMGKCCVAGASEIRVSEEEKIMKSGEKIYREGDVISLDGSTGTIYEGDIPKASFNMIDNFHVLMNYVDKIRTMKVRANADNPRDAKKALELGAEGIGLCRTEHMFFEEDRILKVRKMIMAKKQDERIEYLNELLPFQRKDFSDIYEVMGGRPVTIRLLDPPLHEFLPHDDEDIKEVAEAMGKSFDEVKDIVNSLHEFNPMLGHRGCRLAITYPEIYIMQATAIIEAALEVKSKGINMEPEIMIPLISTKEELRIIRQELENAISDIFEKKQDSIKYTIGTMIEVPRAAITADEIAEIAEFFSFGTNDMTQMGFGFSRDDSGKFLSEYVEKEILKASPFETIEQEGIGKFVKIASELGRKTKSGLKLGVCGEHGGDPESVKFFYSLGLDYVSCSPFRIPIAKLASAQAVLKK